MEEEWKEIAEHWKRKYGEIKEEMSLLLSMTSSILDQNEEREKSAQEADKEHDKCVASLEAHKSLLENTFDEIATLKQKVIKLRERDFIDFPEAPEDFPVEEVEKPTIMNKLISHIYERPENNLKGEK